MLLQKKKDKSFMVCGIDEAGRGPLAGPVCAAAVILKEEFPVEILNDSKKMKTLRREEVHKIICEKALTFGIGWASHTEIDELNILQASLLAMKRAYKDMIKKAREKNVFMSDADMKVIIDGTFVPDLAIPCEAMVKADAKIHEVMAASILAKHERDVYMDKMAVLYPQYNYEKHKGYPTKTHREAVLKHGPSPIQRLTFKVKL